VNDPRYSSMNSWETLAVIGLVYVLVFVAHRAS